MKRLILTGIAITWLIVPGVAADGIISPTIVYPPHADYAYPPPALVWSWTGFYIGANVGITAASRGGTSISNTGTGFFGTALAAGQIPLTIGIGEAGFLGGGQVGLDWQIFSAWVVGIQGDFDGSIGTSNSVSATFAGNKSVPSFSTMYQRELNSLGTARGKFGYASTPDLLGYLTGGVAFGETELATAFTCATCSPASGTESTVSLSTSKMTIGWVVGAGLEWKATPFWSLKAEYLYVDLGSPSNTVTYSSGATVSTFTSTVHEHDNIVRLGINYKLF